MSTSERVQLWAMRGLTAAEITHQTKLPRSTVKYHLKRFKETGSWSRREYPVRVKTLTPFAECIRKHLKLHPHASATELHELLASKYQLMVSVRTVQRYLKSAGREQKKRDDNSEAGDSDTSTTEELSVASGSERSSSPKLKALDGHHATRIPSPIGQETRFNGEKVANNFGAPPNFASHMALAHPLFGAHARPIPIHPAMLSTPYGLLSPYGLLPTGPAVGWQSPDAQSAAPGPAGFPLVAPPSLPLGVLPLYPQFNPSPSDALISTLQNPAFLNPTPAASTPTSGPVASFPSNPEPGLEALLNAALVNE